MLAIAVKIEFRLYINSDYLLVVLIQILQVYSCESLYPICDGIHTPPRGQIDQDEGNEVQGKQ